MPKAKVKTTKAKEKETKEDVLGQEETKDVLKDTKEKDDLIKENEKLKSDVNNLTSLVEGLAKKLESLDSIVSVPKEKQESDFKPLNNLEEFSDITPRYMVRVTSLYHGGLNLKGINRDIRFDRFGQSKNIRFEDVEEIASRNESFLKNGFFFIHDDRVLRLLYIEHETYDKLIEPEVLKNVFTLPTDEIEELYKNTTPDLRKAMLYTFAEWINKNDPFYLDKNKIDAINNVSGENVIEIAKMLKEE
jgi:hypothetical protein